MANTITNRNVRAFLSMIRYCEGTDGIYGYATMFGGKIFESFADHPRQLKVFKLGGKEYKSSAAGAYQFLQKTWDALVKQHGYRDFSPESQDYAAIELIRGRRALDDVINGDLKTAIEKCNKEWASLPGSPYGQPVKTYVQCETVYLKNGGVLK